MQEDCLQASGRLATESILTSKPRWLKPARFDASAREEVLTVASSSGGQEPVTQNSSPKPASEFSDTDSVVSDNASTDNAKVFSALALNLSSVHLSRLTTTASHRSESQTIRGAQMTGTDPGACLLSDVENIGKGQSSSSLSQEVWRTNAVTTCRYSARAAVVGGASPKRPRFDGVSGTFGLVQIWDRYRCQTTGADRTYMHVTTCEYSPRKNIRSVANSRRRCLAHVPEAAPSLWRFSGTCGSSNFFFQGMISEARFDMSFRAVHYLRCVHSSYYGARNALTPDSDIRNETERVDSETQMSAQQKYYHRNREELKEKSMLRMRAYRANLKAKTVAVSAPALATASTVKAGPAEGASIAPHAPVSRLAKNLDPTSPGGSKSPTPEPQPASPPSMHGDSYSKVLLEQPTRGSHNTAKNQLREVRLMLYEWTKGMGGPVAHWPMVFQEGYSAAVREDMAAGGTGRVVEEFIQGIAGHADKGHEILQHLLSSAYAGPAASVGIYIDMWLQASEMMATLHHGIAVLEVRLDIFAPRSSDDAGFGVRKWKGLREGFEL
ncbi:hypothetical protein PLICRDRAFT_26388 [Plicaturopsis crispa FD-325 SS-3]|nr:hypothetical protein PLICRDRAFT_26388 [Plicaturopsis crispa FD-325 SS-3]